MKQLKSLRNDCSTGVDNIPIKYIKPIVEYICSPLTHIINCFIVNDSYPLAWKLSRVVPINKIKIPVNTSDYRPISFLNTLNHITFIKIPLVDSGKDIALQQHC